MTAALRLTLLACLLWPIAAVAETPLQVPTPATTQPCDVPAYLLDTESPLNRVTEAMKSNRLNILVIGSRSSSLVASVGVPLTRALPNNPAATSGPPDSAYPGKLQQILRDRLPTLEVNVTLDLQPKRTAEEIVSGLPQVLEANKPDLVIWQTGTVDAVRAIDPDDFREAIDEGVVALQKAGADVLLMNLQYSPRTETMISPAPYVDNMRLVAQQYNIPVFDRFAIMRQWHENGDFDLFNPSPSIDMAKQVHQCLARALATFVIDAARVKPTEMKTQR